MGASASMALRNEAAKPHDASDIASDTAAVAEVTKLRQRLRRTVQSQMRTMEPPALVGIAESLTSAGAYIGAERALRLALVKAPTDVAIFQKYQHFVHSLDAGERLSSVESSSQIETLTASSSCPSGRRGAARASRRRRASSPWGCRRPWASAASAASRARPSSTRCRRTSTFCSRAHFTYILT